VFEAAFSHLSVRFLALQKITGIFEVIRLPDPVSVAVTPIADLVAGNHITAIEAIFILL